MTPSSRGAAAGQHRQAGAESDYICPRCGARTHVARTTKSLTEIRRQRICDNEHKFDTVERSEHPLEVKRSDGRIEPFSKDQLERSLFLASARTLSEKDIAEATDRVVWRLYEGPHEPVTSEEIGYAVIKELQHWRPTAAIRYALYFLSSRGVARTPDTFRNWLDANYPSQRNDELTSSRPATVIKKFKATRQIGYVENFMLPKLWKGLALATKGLVEKGVYEAEGEWGGDEFVGALAAYVLADVDGQPSVRAMQLSSAVMHVLRSVCPFGYLRFAQVAKEYSGIGPFRLECEALLQYPAPKIDLEQYRAAGRELALEVQALER